MGAALITVTEAAAVAFGEASAEAGEEVLHLEVSARFEYDLYYGPPGPSDLALPTESGVTLYVDPSSRTRIEALVIDHVPGPSGGFRLKDTLQPEPVRQVSPRQAKELLDQGALTLVDVRTDAERALVMVQGSLHLDAEGEARLDALDRESPVAFLCHHGIRSLAAAERFARKGFRKVYNVQGGIDAWAVTVDPTLRRY